jgi:alkylated DNA repair protein (DNA oxidative demethylase)
MFSNPALEIAPQVFVLPRFASTAPLREQVAAITAQSPFRHMVVPGGLTMKVALSNCGDYGWASDARVYRYSAADPVNGAAWPAMPEAFSKLAHDAAAACGFESFAPDACLINRYVAGAGMGLHQDRQEKDFTQPIVSVSIGASCKFIVGGLQRSDATRSIALHDGDVMVWGGASRLLFHGVRPLSEGSGVRYNLTMRKAM